MAVVVEEEEEEEEEEVEEVEGVAISVAVHPSCLLLACLPEVPPSLAMHR